MAKKPETVLKEWFQEKIKDIPNTWSFKTQQVALLGIPDLVGITNGFGWVVELKSSEEAKLSPLQVYNLKKVSDAGGYAFVGFPTNKQHIIEGIQQLSKDHAGEVTHDQSAPWSIKLQ